MHWRNNVAKHLTKRTAPETESLKPKKEAPEPATYLCEDARTVVTAAERIPMGGMCVECHVNPAHSEVGHLCYPCRKAKDGFVYDEEKNRFVKEKHGR